MAVQLCAGAGVTVESETLMFQRSTVPGANYSRFEADRSASSSADMEELDLRIFAHPQEGIMDTTTLLVIILIILVLGGGGFYGRGRWF